MCLNEFLMTSNNNNVNTDSRFNSKGENHPLKIVAKFSRFWLTLYKKLNYSKFHGYIISYFIIIYYKIKSFLTLLFIIYVRL